MNLDGNTSCPAGFDPLGLIPPIIAKRAVVGRPSTERSATHRLPTIAAKLFLPLSLVVAAIAGLAGYQWAKTSVAEAIYRDRLVVLQDDYRDLAKRYNQAVTPRPVTELLVEDGIVCLAVRKGDGERVRIPTDFNIRENQVYVDFVVVDQRLLIRRAFEFHRIHAVPPDKVVNIDPELLEVDWDPERVPYGKALSCSGLDDGRYIVSVTGGGSLGLKQVSDDEAIVLQTHPSIGTFEAIDEQAAEDVQAIGIGDVWQHLMD